MRLLSILLAALACSGDATQATNPINPFTPHWVTPTGDTLVLREDLRIGVLDGPDEYTLVYVTDVVVDSTGRIYTFDTGNGTAQQIRQYDKDGSFIRNFGRGGEGPGEYSMWIDMTVLSNGDLLVADENELSRLTQFKPDGSVVTIHAGKSGDGRNLLIPTAEGGWITEITWREIRAGNGWVHAFTRYDAAGKLLDTIPPTSEHIEIAKYTFGDKPTGVGTSFQGALPDGALIAANSESFDLVLRRNDATTTISRQLVREQNSDLERDGYRAQALRNGRDPSRSDLPEFKDTYRWVGTLDSGHIFAWLHSPATAYDDSDRGENALGFRRQRITDILDSQGTWVGRLVEVMPYVIRADTIWGVATGSEGEQYVGRWVIER